MKVKVLRVVVVWRWGRRSGSRRDSKSRSHRSRNRNRSERSSRTFGGLLVLLVMAVVRGKAGGEEK